MHGLSSIHTSANWLHIGRMIHARPAGGLSSRQNKQASKTRMLWKFRQTKTTDLLKPYSACYVPVAIKTWKRQCAARRSTMTAATSLWDSTLNYSVTGSNVTAICSLYYLTNNYWVLSVRDYKGSEIGKTIERESRPQPSTTATRYLLYRKEEK